MTQVYMSIHDQNGVLFLGWSNPLEKAIEHARLHGGRIAYRHGADFAYWFPANWTLTRIMEIATGEIEIGMWSEFVNAERVAA